MATTRTWLCMWQSTIENGGKQWRTLDNLRNNRRARNQGKFGDGWWLCYCLSSKCWLFMQWATTRGGGVLSGYVFGREIRRKEWGNGSTEKGWLLLLGLKGDWKVAWLSAGAATDAGRRSERRLCISIREMAEREGWVCVIPESEPKSKLVILCLHAELRTFTCIFYKFLNDKFIKINCYFY